MLAGTSLPLWEFLNVDNMLPRAQTGEPLNPPIDLASTR